MVNKISFVFRGMSFGFKEYHLYGQPRREWTRYIHETVVYHSLAFYI